MIFLSIIWRLLQLVKRCEDVSCRCLMWHSGSIPPDHTVTSIWSWWQRPPSWEGVHLRAQAGRDCTVWLYVSVNWRIRTLLSDRNCLSLCGVVFGLSESVFLKGTTRCGQCCGSGGCSWCDVLSFPLVSNTGKKGQFDTSLSPTSPVACKIPICASIFDPRTETKPHSENTDFNSQRHARNILWKKSFQRDIL